MDRLYKCIIVDDEEMAIKVISSHLKKVPDFQILGQFNNPVEAFQELDKQAVDVLFLDIQMPEITGLSMLKIIKQPPLTVLTTAYREYAIEGFELEVVDYLLKPIGFQRFLQTISRLRQRMKAPQYSSEKIAGKKISMDKKEVNSDCLFIKTNRIYQKIHFKEITHIESIRNHIKVHTANTTFISLVPISEIEKNLPENFVRLHRSFIVNTGSIIRFDNHEVINQKAEIPIGRTYREEALKKIKRFLLDS